LGYTDEQDIKKNVSIPSLLEQIPVGDEFYKDENTFSYIEQILPNDKKVRKQFKGDLDWFQENYQESYIDKEGEKKRGIYCNKPKDNTSVIENFYKYLQNKQKSKDDKTNMQWLRDIYNKVDVDMINLKLKELYLS